MSTHVLAIAIEDRVDVWYGHEMRSRRYKPLERLAEPIPEGGNYMQAVLSVLKRLLLQLRRKHKTTECVEDIFDRIGSTVISVPGVVENQQTLVQIPVWNSDKSKDIDLRIGRRDHTSAHFPRILGQLIADLVKAEGRKWPLAARRRFEATVWAVNDTTACAAFEHDRRGARAGDFSYTKVHAGTNVAIVEATTMTHYAVRMTHGEVGHMFPLIHRLDEKFNGVCVHHGWCLEGMAAAHSFTQRALSGSNDTFKKWKAHLTRKQSRLSGQALDNDLIDFILGEGDAPPAAGDDVGVEILAHYVGQLIWNVALSGMSSQIVLGGRMARPRVLAAIHRNVRRWSNGYPRRRELSADIEKFIRLSCVKPDQQDVVEVWGAFAIAAARAWTSKEFKDKSAWTLAKMQPLMQGIVDDPK